MYFGFGPLHLRSISGKDGHSLQIAHLEKLRTDRLNWAAAVFQKNWKRSIAERRFHAMRAASIKIQQRTDSLVPNESTLTICCIRSRCATAVGPKGARTAQAFARCSPCTEGERFGVGPVTNADCSQNHVSVPDLPHATHPKGVQRNQICRVHSPKRYLYAELATLFTEADMRTRVNSKPIAG